MLGLGLRIYKIACSILLNLDISSTSINFIPIVDI